MTLMAINTSENTRSFTRPAIHPGDSYQDTQTSLGSKNTPMHVSVSFWSAPLTHHVSFPFFYWFWGACHEITHWAVTQGFCNTDAQAPTSETLGRALTALFQRHIAVDLTPCPNHGQALFWIQHSGWIVSLLLAILVTITWYVSRRYHPHNEQSGCKKRNEDNQNKHNKHNNKTNHNQHNKMAWMSSAMAMAWLVAFEALWTDYFQLPVLVGITHVSSTQQVLFYCGNFGIIVLHHSWLSSHGGPAFDVLQRMIQVTMMRGAQSGGLVTFRTQDGEATRVRVVNSKRTDLSRLVRQQVAKRLWWQLPPKRFAPTIFSGHTRFATSSKATLDGTHPHRWTPARKVRFFDRSTTDKKFETRLIENYITHNGDFDYYTTANGKTVDVETVQAWLAVVLEAPIPATVDSSGIAGMVDVMRTQGCFSLSARYTAALGLSTSQITSSISSSEFPTMAATWEPLGRVFEACFLKMIQTATYENLVDYPERRTALAQSVVASLEKEHASLIKTLQPILNEDEDDDKAATLTAFCLVTINAFLDNDLFFTTKTFLKNAKGSFGLCVNSSLDAHRQTCVAARGQTMSIAFYPAKGLICYGSEQAAVKAGLSIEFPGNEKDPLGRSMNEIDHDALRFDLDDLGGEIVCIDWRGYKDNSAAVSKPNRHLTTHWLMNDKVSLTLYEESKATTRDPQLYHRMTRLSRNRFVKPLKEESDDLILTDIQDIPRICHAIQEDWRSRHAAKSINRLTAFNLSRCLRNRLEQHVNGTSPQHAVDILVTGCEVSLWVAEQFAADLQKMFPHLRTKAISSNKVLGLFGQEISVPTLGFPYTNKTYDLHDTIVIIVSHSGGTFAPLACSNLMQSTTRNIFCVTSEWDTQIGKQLRAMDALDNKSEDIISSRIFTTECSMRPAEPCSLTVAATHQLMTNLLTYIGALVLSDVRYARALAAQVTEVDLQTLERCNRDNIDALSEIVGSNRFGYELDHMGNRSEVQLRAAGDLWANHILEVVKAYIMTVIYIFVTVTSGWPLAYALARAGGLGDESDWIYLVKAVDALIYIWLPQINCILLRMLERRNIRHRMSGRTVAIADIPWVAQSAEAFLSKIFAVSYSIAGLNVLSGNPVDHFVHRHTHRVVRGTLLVCGRPDGRLSALSTAEAATCLSVNQASSIQSLGGTCESVTIGHNPFTLPLSKVGIFLKRKRPMFLCERLLHEQDASLESAKSLPDEPRESKGSRRKPHSRPWYSFFYGKYNTLMYDLSQSQHQDVSIKLRVQHKRSAAALIGSYMNIEHGNQNTLDVDEVEAEEPQLTVEKVVEDTIKQRKWSDRARKLYNAFDLDNDGFLSETDFVEASYRLQSGLTEDQIRKLFKVASKDGSDHIDYDEFLSILEISDIDTGIKLPSSTTDAQGRIHIEPSAEKYFGENLRKINAGKSKKDVDFKLARSQHLAQELYETRVASMQRFVAMTVMFHQMGMRVEKFFERISFGLLGYRMDRTHSIMRIATTASPISGADVRQRMRELQLLKKVQHSIHIIETSYIQYRVRKESKRIKELERKVSNVVT